MRVIDDYGHHPAEVRATLAAAREVHAGRIVVAFQPHRYSRTRDLWDEFVGAFNDADVLVLLGPAFDQVTTMSKFLCLGVPMDGVIAASALLAAHALAPGVRFAPDLDRVLANLLEIAAPGDLVVTLGAGSISTLGARLLAGLAERAS